MKIYGIADLHLSFSENIDKPMSIFGRDWEGHEERLRLAWTKLVNEEDIVLIPGDISWALRLDDAISDFDWIHSLPGKKIISKGNHDLWWSKITYLNSLYDDMIFLQNNCYQVEGEPVIIVASRGWPYPGSDEYTEHDEKIYARELGRLRLGLEEARALISQNEAHDNWRIVACLHFPPSDFGGKKTGFTDILEEYGVSQCIYGHLHGASSYGRGIRGLHRGIEYSLVSMDYLAGTPRLIYDSEET